MGGERYEAAREFLFHLRSLLLSKYKRVEFRFVGFSGDAQEFKLAKFFKSFIGGSTKYSKGYQKSRSILKEYPDGRWDKYQITIGDLEDTALQETLSEIDGMIEGKEVQYNAVIYTNYHSSGDALVQEMKKREEADPSFGYAEINADSSSPLNAIQWLFRKRGRR